MSHLNPRALPVDCQLLSISHATVVKSGNVVLNDLSMNIGIGQHTAIIGPNGSGKSSLIKLLTRQYYPLARADGQPTVQIFGKDRWDVFELRSQLGIVSADLHANFLTEPEITGREVALSGFFASKGIGPNHHVTQEREDLALAALHRLGVRHLADRPIGHMSTGEGRRCVIARALVTRPQALVLDEPTTGLDMAAQQRFLESLRRLAQQGATIILVTHHVEEIIPEVQQVIMLADGRVLVSGPKSSVLTAANLSRAYSDSITIHQRGEFFSAEVALEASTGDSFQSEPSLVAPP